MWNEVFLAWYVSYYLKQIMDFTIFEFTNQILHSRFIVAKALLFVVDAPKLSTYQLRDFDLSVQ